METCLCRQTLKIKDLYQICIYFCEKWFKLKVKPCRIIALKDFWIELIIYWEPTIRIYSYSCIKSVFSSTVKHNFGSILVSSIRYSLIGYVCITHQCTYAGSSSQPCIEYCYYLKFMVKTMKYFYLKMHRLSKWLNGRF